MHAPQSPAPHPNRVPGIFRASRMIQSSGISGGASTDTCLPLTLKVVLIDPINATRPVLGIGPLSVIVTKRLVH
jgi:hypothetical protein